MPGLNYINYAYHTIIGKTAYKNKRTEKTEVGNLLMLAFDHAGVK